MIRLLPVGFSAFLCDLHLLFAYLCDMMNTTEELVAERVGFPTLSCLSVSFGVQIGLKHKVIKYNLSKIGGESDG